MPEQADEIRTFSLRNVPENPRDIIRLTAPQFGVSRQAVSYHVRKLTDEGRLRATGRASARTYALLAEGGDWLIEGRASDQVQETRSRRTAEGVGPWGRSPPRQSPPTGVRRASMTSSRVRGIRISLPSWRIAT